MQHPGLWISVVAGLVASTVFAFVGQRQYARLIGRDRRGAARAFTVWWWSLAGYSFVVGVVLNALAAVGETSVSVFLVGRTISTVLLCIALGGLTAYLAFLYTGSRRAMSVGVLVASGLYAFVVWAFRGHTASGVFVGEYTTRLLFTPALSPSTLALVVYALTLPQVVCGILLLALYPRVTEPTSRWRLLLVGSCILVWSIGALLANLSGSESMVVIMRPVTGTLAAIVSYYAYEPPAWVQARYRVTSL